MRFSPLLTCFLAAAVWSGTSPKTSPAFNVDSKGDKPCTACHTLTVREAEELLRGLVDRVVDVRPCPVSGLYEVDIQKQNQTIPVYIDFSKRHVISGNLIDLVTRENLTMERSIDLNRVDVASIPLEDAVVLGNVSAPKRIIVFDDPECPYCKKLHEEMKKAVLLDPSVAFHIKMLPLKIHPNAREKAKAIICEKSAQLLEDSLAGKPLPKPSCETDQIEKNEALAERLRIHSTPTLILPDGRVLPGYRPAEKILEYLAASPDAAAKQATK